MKWIAILGAALIVVASLLLIHPGDNGEKRISVVRDSVVTVWEEKEAKHDTFRIFLRTASSDTLGAILRDRANRPPIFVHDTILGQDSTEDSSGACEVTLTCQDARRIALRDSSSSLMIDSLRGALVVSKSEKDSVATSCQTPSILKSSLVGFGLGYGAGILTCIAIR